MIQYVVVNGFPGSGKTTFERECTKVLGENGCCISSIDIVKDAAVLLGWNGEKTPESRRFLSLLKELSSQFLDSSWKYVEECVKEAEASITSDNKKLIAFVDVREPEEIQRYVDERNAITIFINRENVANLSQSNISDTIVDQYEYDYIIDNNGTIEDLTNKAKSFILNIL